MSGAALFCQLAKSFNPCCKKYIPSARQAAVTGAIYPVRGYTAGLRVLWSFIGCCWRFAFLSSLFGLFDLSNFKGAPSGFTSVDTRFDDYQTVPATALPAPTGFMPVDAWFDDFVDWIAIVSYVSDGGFTKVFKPSFHRRKVGRGATSGILSM